jgi:ATP-binding cassette subfamily C protein
VSATETSGHRVGALSGPVGSLMMPLLRALDSDRSVEVAASTTYAPDRPFTFGRLGIVLDRWGFDVAQGGRARDRWHQAIDGGVVLQDSDGTYAAYVQRAGRVSRVGSSLDGTSIPDPVEADPETVARQVERARRVLHLRAVFAVPLSEFDENLRSVLAAGFGLSLFINMFGLGIPYLTMVVYDRVIGGVAPEIIPGLAVGGFLTLVAILALRRMRAVLLAAALGRFGMNLQVRVLRRLIRAPLAASGRMQAYAILARTREAWRSVDPLSNALTTALFDAPFILLTLLAIGFIGGLLVLVPFLYLVAFFAIALLLERRSRLHLQLAGAAMAERDAMLAELAEKAVELRLSGVQDAWFRRFSEVSQRVTNASMYNATRSAVTQSVAYVLGTGVALITLMAGIVLVLENSMTAGGLIAVMLLIWRIVGPAQALFFSLGRLRQSRSQRQRLEALLQGPVEADRPSRLAIAPRTRPSLRFERVSYRFPGAPELSLTGISFSVGPGEIVAVVGPSGSGKSTVLQIAAGLLTPQVGVVLVDGRNLSHFDPDDYRLAVAAYMPARTHVFHTSLKDNIALAAPWIDDAAVARVVHDTWPAQVRERLDKRLELGTPLDSASYLHAADDMRLAFARLAAKASPIAILDTTFFAAEPDARRTFEDYLVASRGSTTVLFSAEDPAMARFADKVLVLNAGVAAYFGPPALTPVPKQAAR